MSRGCMVEPVGPVEAGPYPAAPAAEGYSLAGAEGAGRLPVGRGQWRLPRCGQRAEAPGSLWRPEGGGQWRLSRCRQLFVEAGG